jgi:hypothetical protein
VLYFIHHFGLSFYSPARFYFLVISVDCLTGSHGVGTGRPYFTLSLVFLLSKIFAASRFGGSEQGSPLARPTAPARTSSHELDWFFLSTGSQIPFQGPSAL